MPTPPSGRSVKIDQDERGAWSSDGPRRSGPPRAPDLAVRCQVLRPAELLRYSPGSLLLVVSPGGGEAEGFAGRLIEERGALLTAGKVRALLAGRVADEELEQRAGELLVAAAAKRLEARESVVVAAAAIATAQREPLVRAAADRRRPRHLILVEPPREQVAEDDRRPLNDLRKAVDSGALGAEGFNTALRLGPSTAAEVRRIVFRPPPEE